MDSFQAIKGASSTVFQAGETKVTSSTTGARIAGNHAVAAIHRAEGASRRTRSKAVFNARGDPSTITTVGEDRLNPSPPRKAPSTRWMAA